MIATFLARFLLAMYCADAVPWLGSTKHIWNTLSLPSVTAALDAEGVSGTGKALGKAVGLQFDRLQVQGPFADVVAFENKSEGIGRIGLEVVAGSIGTGLEQAVNVATVVLVLVLFLVFEEGHEFLDLGLEHLDHGVAVGEGALLAFEFLEVVLLTGFALLGNGGFILAAR